MGTAIYSILSGSVIYYVPKRKGKGFLKSCIGWHSLNKEGALLTELLDDKNYIDNSIGALCDLDGHLSISIKTSYTCYPDRMETVVSELNDILKQVFPHITEFEED